MVLLELSEFRTTPCGGGLGNTYHTERDVPHEAGQEHNRNTKFGSKNFRHASDLTYPEAGAAPSSGLLFRDHACFVDRNRGDHGCSLGILGRRYFSNLRFHLVYTTTAKNEQGESQGSSGSGTGRYGVGANGSRKNRPESSGMVPQPPSHHSSSITRGFKNARIFAKFRTGLCRVDFFCVQPRSTNRYRQFRLHCFPIGFYNRIKFLAIPYSAVAIVHT